MVKTRKKAGRIKRGEGGGGRGGGRGGGEEGEERRRRNHGMGERRYIGSLQMERK